MNDTTNGTGTNGSTRKGPPETQITMRLDPSDLPLLREVRDTILERSPIKPRDADIHRSIYHEGLLAMRAKLMPAAAPQVVDEAPPRDEEADPDRDPFLDEAR